jgi:iron(III) transport system permease protein
MGMMIFYTNAGVKVVHALLSGVVLARTQVWRKR